MPTEQNVSFAFMMTGAFELLRRKAYPVFVASLCFAMLCALSSAFTERQVSRIEQELASSLSLTPEQTRSEIQSQLFNLSSLSLEEFVAVVENRVRKSATESPLEIESSALGLTFAVRAGPYLMLELVFDVAVFFSAAIFFLLLFTRGMIGSFDALRLLPWSVPMSVLLLLRTVLHPFLFMTFIGPILGLTVYLSGESSMGVSIKSAGKRFFSKPFTVLLNAVAVLATAFLLLWPLIILVAAISLFSLKLGFLLLLTSLMLCLAFLCASVTMLAAMLA